MLKKFQTETLILKLLLNVLKNNCVFLGRSNERNKTKFTRQNEKEHT